ncbi:MAG: iron export ABC transporter permease subunit FetB [Proteobacteria bacterium]|nr:iron export ABC transporter permease subunit FetB [Pseudomonadota bacterium]
MYQSLTYLQVALAGALVLVNGALSALLQLKLGKQLAIAAVRMVVQLLLVGLVLRFVFAHSSWFLVAGIIVIMSGLATSAAVQRPDRVYTGMWWDGLMSVVLGGWTMGLFAAFVVLREDPWYQPQTIVPLMGMILGNTLTGVSLGINHFTDSVVGERDQIEAMLSLGASRAEAARPALSKAVRTGMIPTINGMMVAGIVSLPGMMTGQLLSGIDPVEAVKYQIVVMFLIASGASLATVAAALLVYRRVFSSRHQLQGWMLRERRK